MKQQRLSVFLLITILFLGTGNVYAQKRAVKQIKLDNGLTIILNEDHSKTEVFGMVVVNAGAKDDPKDATGMAHYQEHMLFKGTTELGTSNWEKERPHINRIVELYDELGKTKEDSLRLIIQKKINKESIEAGKYTILNELSTLIDKMGGSNLNAGTGMDQTVYYNSFPPNQIDRWIDLYSHRFINPVFRAFQSELETVYEEKNMYQDNFITALLDGFNRNFYKKHPYGQQTIIGETEHLKNPSLSKMYKFFHTYYVPNNMAVVLIGDFDSETVLPLLKEKFGQWKSKELPQQQKYVEQEFNGREEVVGKYSPIKMALLGFRTVPTGHPDELALGVFNNLIYNEKGTGVLNKLTQNGEVMAVEAIEMHNQDYGANIFMVVPKLIGQKLRTAENLVLNAMREVRDGQIDDKILEQSKKEMYVNYQLGLEDFETLGYSLSSYFMQGKDVNALYDQPERINALDKAEVLRVAQKYYGDNYLAFYSKMGSPDKEKLSKPNYDPVTTDKKGVSRFAKAFGNIPEKACEMKYVDFKKDVQKLKIANGVQLYSVNNPKNDIYTADIVFHVGSLKIKEAEYIANLFNTAGSKDLTRDQLQDAFAQIGSSYSCSADAKKLVISLSGMEKDVDEAMSLIGKLIAAPVVSEKDVNTTANNLMSERKIEREDPANVAYALLGYVAYGDKSKTKYRMGKKEIKRFGPSDFERIWKLISQYEFDVHYVGKKKAEQVGQIIRNTLTFNANPVAEDRSVYAPLKEYNSNMIYFVNRKDAVQSNIFFFANGDQFSKEQVPVQEAFNAYFGGGFSGLVLQEIREYRSLAYSAGAYYVKPEMDGEYNYFMGMIGTQADKTLDAIKVFYDLKKDMPQMPERMSYIKPYLAQQVITSFPNFRNLSASVKAWERLGYEKDPSVYTSQKIKELSFADIYQFYKLNIQNKSMVTMIVGDRSKIDMSELSKYGKIKFLKEKELYTK
ncbi:MAG: M16 family metallopeptidase [Marinifilaceae bacterium]